MALCSLFARTRTAATASLRLPPPAAPLRVDCMAKESIWNQLVKRRSCVDLVRKEIHEAKLRLREKIPIIWKDIWGTVRLWVVAGAAIELMLFSSSHVAPEK